MTERDIFLAAIEINNLDEREEYVNRACVDDLELKSRVQELLDSHEQTSQFLETPAILQESSFDETVESGSLQKDDSYSIRASEEEEFLKFLEPAKQQGWLGKLGHYEVEEILGRGAFGIVAKAFDEKLHRVVAIKMMSPGIASTSPPRKRFLREARTAAAVNHENIAAIYAVEEEPIPYLVMEYVAGLTLQDRMKAKGPFDVEEVLEIGRQIASGLAAAHAVNLIHRDIKPSNILLTDSPIERAKISDFGLARAVDDASMTQSGVIAGTPMYMAPEQARGESLDHRADLFSLGSVLYQMVSGRPPFRAANTIAVLKRVCDDEPRPIPDIIRETPFWLCAIISRLMEKDRERRFGSAQEVADLLNQCQKELDQKGTVTCVEGNSSAASWQAKTEETNKSEPKNRSTGLIIGGIIVILAFIGIVFAIQWKPDQSRHSPVQTNDTTTITESIIEGNREGWHGWSVDAPPPAIAPFNAEQAKAHQKAWASYLGVPVEYENSIGMKFRLMPPGEFMMGSTPEEIEAGLKVALEYEQERFKSEGPQHQVVLTQPVYVGVTQVTQSQYELVMGSNPSNFSSKGEGKDLVANLATGNHPVEMVSWNDASEFCAKLSQQEQLKPFYFRSGETVTPLEGTGYRLPTEAEWEYACRAGTTTQFWTGDEEQDLVSAGWFGSNSGRRTHTVGELKANPFGLSDMHGNVWEWVQDSWDPAFYGKFQEDAAINPSNSFLVASQPVLRGGHWNGNLTSCRSSRRHAHHPTFRTDYIGFRVVLPVNSVLKNLSPRDEEVSKDKPAVDLLALIDPKKHSIRNGQWSIDEGLLKSPFVEQKYSIVEIPYYPPEEYDLKIIAERVSAVPEILGIGLPVQDRHVIAVLDGWTGRASGLELLDGQNASSNQTTIQRRLFATNKKHEIICRVRKSSIAVLVDGESVIDWKGDVSRFSAPIPQWRIPYSRNLYMGVNSAEYHFHGMTLTPVSPVRDRDKKGYQFRDPDMRAAEWALSLGGRVHYELAGRRQDVSNAGQLPDVPFHLVEIDLSRTDAEGWEYVALEGLEQLEKLTLNSRHVQTDQALDSIMTLSSLSELDLQAKVGPDEPVTPQIVSQLRNALPKCHIKWIGGEIQTGWHGRPTDAPAPAIAPFDAEQAKAHQKAWANYLGVPVEYENSIGMNFRLIPPGEFMMGSSPKEIALHSTDEFSNLRRPSHNVLVEEPFYISSTEVTQSQYRAITGENPSHFSSLGDGKAEFADSNTDDLPVENVSWNDAQKFCSKLTEYEVLQLDFDDMLESKKETSAPIVFRLPTDTEWEFACRAGTTTRFWSSNNEDEITNIAWCATNSNSRTHEVGELNSNPFGLFDMHGNVKEWILNDWADNIAPDTKPELLRDNPLLEESQKSVRSGSWNTKAYYCRSGHSHPALPNYRNPTYGLRIVVPAKSIKPWFDKQSLKLDGEGDYVQVPELDLSNTEAISIHLQASLLSDQPVHNSPVIYWRTDDQEYYLGPRIHSGRTFWRFFIMDQFGNSEWWDLCEANKGQIYLLNVQLDGKNSPSFKVNGKQVKPTRYQTSPEKRSEKLLFPKGNMKTAGLNIGGRFDNQGEPQGTFGGKIYKLIIVRAIGNDFTTASDTELETVVHFPFKEGQGDRLADVSGNNFHGTIVGAQWAQTK